jgi:hypothetical protein
MSSRRQLLERLELESILGTRLGDFYGINGFVLPDSAELDCSFPDWIVTVPAFGGYNRDGNDTRDYEQTETCQ